MAKKNQPIDTTGLESAEKTPLSKNVKNSGPDFSDLKFLQEANPEDFISKETASPKWEAEREMSIQKGLKILMSQEINGIKLNPLIVELGRWWEHKIARAEIRKAIEAEAEAKGSYFHTYLQGELSKQIDQLAEIQDSIDRLKYARTYFKPRNGATGSVKTTMVTIDGEHWEIPTLELNKANAEFETREEKIEYLKSVGKISTNVIEL